MTSPHSTAGPPSGGGSATMVLDPVSALTVLFACTVLFLHAADGTYWVPGALRLDDIGAHLLLQRIAVGGFLFLSGYKLTRGKSTLPCGAFLKNRFARLYALYLLALVSNVLTIYPRWAGHPIGALNFIKHAMCLQSVLYQWPQRDCPTIWFVSTLFCCYGFFLVTRRSLAQPWRFACSTAGAILCVELLHAAGARAGVSLFAPFVKVALAYFALGMLFARFGSAVHGALRTGRLFALAACGSVLFLGVPGLAAGGWGPVGFASDASALTATVPLFACAFRHAGQLRLPAWLTRVSGVAAYATYGVFLFHRSVWSALSGVWRTISIPQFLFVAGIGTALTWLLAYAAQASYDRVVRRTPA